VIVERALQFVFTSDAFAYAVSAAAALEVIPAPRLTRVPGLGPEVLGLFVHRGRLLPLVDLPRLMGASSGASSRRVLVMESSLGRLGVPVTSVLGPVSLGEARPPGREHPSFVVGLADGPSSDLLAIDPDLLARSLRDDERHEM